LKALARLVLARDIRRDSVRDRLSRADHGTETPGRPLAASRSIGGKQHSEPATASGGNIPREWAEGLARLDPDRPAGDVRPRRWQRFVDLIEFSERAAIREYDGGFSRAEAERLARAEVLGSRSPE
jgi:hypothetical protein